MNAPICPYCGSQCSPSGGSLSNPEIRFWTCWHCKIEVYDVACEVLDAKESTEILSSNP